MRPIPVNLLVHTIKYEEYTGNDGWDDDFADPVTINKVRVEPVKTLSRTSEAEGERANHIVFVDRVFSSHFPDFKTKSKITFNGVSREITEVKAYYGFKEKPHHYELELR